MPIFIQQAPAAIFTCSFMKALFTSATTANESDPDGIDLYH